MGKGYIRMVKIDEQRLRKELRKRNLTLAGTSRELGHSDGFLNTVLSSTSKQLKYVDCLALQNLYGIKLSDIEFFDAEDVKEEDVKSEQPASVFDWDALGKVIEDAVYRAINR